MTGMLQILFGSFLDCRSSVLVMMIPDLTLLMLRLCSRSHVSALTMPADVEPAVHDCDYIVRVVQCVGMAVVECSNQLVYN